MKFKTTAKALKDGFYCIISAGYCDLQHLLNYENPVAYSSGTYGWNFDIYDIDGVCITTGYRGMPSKNSFANYEMIRLFNDKAQGKTKEERRALLEEFIKLARG